MTHGNIYEVGRIPCKDKSVRLRKLSQHTLSKDIHEVSVSIEMSNYPRRGVELTL